MDTNKVGTLIARLRKEQHLTQRELAQAMQISDKTVSKWECGAGLPDIGLLPELARLLHINQETLLTGELPESTQFRGNMKSSVFYVCPVCGNLAVCTGETQIICCGRVVPPSVPQKASKRLEVANIEDEWFIHSDHPMRKDDYISFLAFLSGEELILRKMYPEWDFQCRLPMRGHGMLLWYSRKDGLQYQLI